VARRVDSHSLRRNPTFGRHDGHVRTASEGGPGDRHGIEPVQDGRIFIELINWPFLHDLRGTPAEYKAGLDLAIERGWLWKHESGTYVKLTQSGADLFA
jgi:hypothetical protein